METFATTGFVFGMSGLSMGIIAKGQIEKIKIDFDEVKAELTQIKILLQEK